MTFVHFPSVVSRRQDGDRLTITVVDVLSGCSGNSDDFRGSIEEKNGIIDLKYKYVGQAYLCKGSIEFSYTLKGIPSRDNKFRFDGRPLSNGMPQYKMTVSVDLKQLPAGVEVTPVKDRINEFIQDLLLTNRSDEPFYLLHMRKMNWEKEDTYTGSELPRPLKPYFKYVKSRAFLWTLGKREWIDYTTPPGGPVRVVQMVKNEADVTTNTNPRSHNEKHRGACDIPKSYSASLDTYYKGKTGHLDVNVTYTLNPDFEIDGKHCP